MPPGTEQQTEIGGSPPKLAAPSARALGGLWLAGLVLAVTLPTAWIGDDALITLHQVRVFVEGDGIVWNPGIRVQGFTHPLWFLLLSGAHALTGALFWPTLVLSLALTVAAVLVLAAFAARQPGLADNPLLGPMFAALVLLAPGFVDYATSGLENPLSHLLAALAIARACRPGQPPDAALWLLLALVVLTRADHALLFAPLAGGLLVEAAGRGRLPAVLPGALVLAAWFGFATVYFGSPLPNTFFAKAAAGVPLGFRLETAAVYFADAVASQGLALPAILFGILFGFAGGPRHRLLAAGIALHLAYLAWIGGDFMRGRFLTLPFLVALFLVAAWLPRARHPAGAMLFAAAIAVPVLAGIAMAPAVRAYSVRAIVDERAHYSPTLGAFALRRDWPAPGGGDFATAAAAEVRFACAVGRRRFETPARVHWVDICALTDPFLARLPAAVWPGMRIGHFVRPIPENYDRVLLGQEPQLSTPEVQGLYEEVMRIATGPVLDPDRLRAILGRLGAGRPGPAGDGAVGVLSMPPARWQIEDWPGVVIDRILKERADGDD